jgi:ABC-type sugar transport system ATPase subunit
MGLVLGAREVTVDFPGTRALDSVSLEVNSGEVLAIVGANGSGKTTLLSVLAGLREPTHGTLRDDAGDLTFRSPADALARRIALVPQEPEIAGTLACWENVVLSRRARFGVTLGRSRRAIGRALVADALPHVDPDAPAGTLRKADRAILALLAALSHRPRLLALDEPTAVLGEKSVEVVAEAIAQVRAADGAVILVSHRLRDVMALADRVVVLVDGRVTHDGPLTGMTVEDLVERLMHGRPDASLPSLDDADLQPAQATRRGGTILSVSDLRTADGLVVDDLQVHQGEIVGLAGLAGGGRSRLLRVLSGSTRAQAGSISYLDGEFPRTIQAARRAGIGYIPEDRARDGVFPPLSVASNLGIGELVESPLASRASGRRQAALARDRVRSFSIHTPHIGAPVTALSGGNQQRVVVSRVLSKHPQVVIADEPTQGVDSGGRDAIHAMLRSFAANDGAIVLASSDFDELLDLCDRIVVLRDGEAVAHVRPRDTDYRSLLSMASGAVHPLHLAPEGAATGEDR